MFVILFDGDNLPGTTGSKFITDTWGIPFDSAEGFLFPDTYLIMRPLELNEATAKSVVGRALKLLSGKICRPR